LSTKHPQRRMEPFCVAHVPAVCINCISISVGV
jgi:hypothetical protein